MSTSSDSILDFIGEMASDSASQSEEVVQWKSRHNRFERLIRLNLFNLEAGLEETGSGTSPYAGEDSSPAAYPNTARRGAAHEYFSVLNKWEGVVLRITKETFWARLADLTQDAPDEEAEFSLDEVPPLEKEWLVPGNVFYWIIGYRDTRGGRKLESEIRFRRVLSPGKREIQRAQKEAADIADAFGWK